MKAIKSDSDSDSEKAMSKKRSPGFSGKNRGVTPSVAAPSVTHPSDATDISHMTAVHLDSDVAAAEAIALMTLMDTYTTFSESQMLRTKTWWTVFIIIINAVVT